MIVERKVRKTGENGKTGDEGLDALNAFIDASVAGDFKNKRRIVTDQVYGFQIFKTTANGKLEPEREIVIPEGHPIYLFKDDGKDATDRNRFLFNLDGRGWEIRPPTGIVRYFSTPIHSRHDADMPIQSINF